jgi:phosphatidylglycerophosphatase A
MKHRISLALASAFYIGFIPGAPGTYAALATTLGFFLVQIFSARIPPSLHLIAVCLITVIGVPVSSEVCRKTGIEDPSFVVIDEVAGQLLTFLFLPDGITNLIMGFIAFRAFDIWKPFPIRKLESLPGGVGIMADDLLAGVYGCVVLHIIHYLFSLL